MPKVDVLNINGQKVEELELQKAFSLLKSVNMLYTK